MQTLLEHHFDDLRKSGLTDEAIRELGFYSGGIADVHRLLGFEAGPGLVIPYPVAIGDLPFCRVKPDQAPIIDGKPARYLSPKGCGLRAYIPALAGQVLRNPTSRLMNHRRRKKAAKACQEGFPCIGIGGVWGFRDREHVLLTDLEEVSWAGRSVYLVPDSDIVKSPQVADATWELGWQLYVRGALVRVIELPVREKGAKQGLDDFLVARGREAFEELL